MIDRCARIDETVVFNRLLREHIDFIAEIGIREVTERLEDGQTMSLDVSNNAKDVIAKIGYDARYGARPLKRVLSPRASQPTQPSCVGLSP
jgi:ATP-dependent Clp protease ATP-binding subunit ClpA